MKVIRKAHSPRYMRDEITSYLLISEITTGSKNLTTTLVEMNPGGMQHIHNHENEQCYFILKGGGIMTVGSEEERVNEGDCIFIPSDEPHGLVNDGKDALVYYSCASPSFKGKALRELWPMESLE